MLKQYQGIMTMIGRLLMAVIFLGAGYNHVTAFKGTAQMLADKLPLLTPLAAQLLLGVACAFLIAGGLSLLIGINARFGAMLLVIFLLAVTPLFHSFWNIPADQVQTQLIHFQKNLAILGGLLFVMAYGPGPVSFDAARARRLK